MAGAGAEEAYKATFTGTDKASTAYKLLLDARNGRYVADKIVFPVTENKETKNATYVVKKVAALTANGTAKDDLTIISAAGGTYEATDKDETYMDIGTYDNGAWTNTNSFTLTALKEGSETDAIVLTIQMGTPIFNLNSQYAIVDTAGTSGTTTKTSPASRADAERNIYTNVIVNVKKYPSTLASDTELTDDQLGEIAGDIKYLVAASIINDMPKDTEVYSPADLVENGSGFLKAYIDTARGKGRPLLSSLIAFHDGDFNPSNLSALTTSDDGADSECIGYTKLDKKIKGS